MLVNIILSKNNEKIPGKLIKRDKNDIIVALGRLGRFDYTIKDNRKISVIIVGPKSM